MAEDSTAPQKAENQKPMRPWSFGRFTMAVFGMVTLVLVFSSCVSTGGGSESEAEKMAAQYTAADPLLDAQKKFANRDYRIFVVVKGMRGFYPGIDGNVGQYYEQRYGAVELPGGADFFDREEYPRFVAAATNYASVYNRTMVNRLAAMEAGSGDGS